MRVGVHDRLRTFEFVSAVGTWRLWTWTPAADLADAVAGLWATEADTVSFRERIVPRETVELMINLGGPQMVHRDGLDPIQHFQRAWVSGLQTDCLEIESPTAARLIAASLRPAHAGPLLGVAGRELTERVVSLDEVIARAAEELAGRIEESPSIVGRFLIFEDFLRDRLRRSRYPINPAVCRAVRRLLDSAGQLPARALSQELGCSPRYLELRMNEQVGMPPKQLARLLRFSQAIEAIRSAPSIDWLEIAAACGYYDQAHFNRDFRRFTGVTPSEFMRTRDPSSQAIMVE
jgi:AraC-like DNA-binding protein